MTLVERRISVLNPDAPLFDPVAFREVEDFSAKWWELVKTSKWFRDYWLSENPEAGFVGGECCDLEEHFEEFVESSEMEDGLEPINAASKLRNSTGTDCKSLMRVLKSPEGKASKKSLSVPKYHDKPAKHVNLKFSPRRVRQINQPR